MSGINTIDNGSVAMHNIIMKDIVETQQKRKTLNNEACECIRIITFRILRSTRHPLTTNNQVAS